MRKCLRHVLGLLVLVLLNSYVLGCGSRDERLFKEALHLEAEHLRTPTSELNGNPAKYDKMLDRIKEIVDILVASGFLREHTHHDGTPSLHEQHVRQLVRVAVLEGGMSNEEFNVCVKISTAKVGGSIRIAARPRYFSKLVEAVEGDPSNKTVEPTRALPGASGSP